MLSFQSLGKNKSNLNIFFLFDDTENSITLTLFDASYYMYIHVNIILHRRELFVFFTQYYSNNNLVKLYNQ